MSHVSPIDSKLKLLGRTVKNRLEIICVFGCGQIAPIGFKRHFIIRYHDLHDMHEIQL